jgi:cysteine desulfurase
MPLGEIYLDCLASTPIDPEVVDAMLPWLAASAAGNPHAASHRAGWRAADAIDAARSEIARLINAEPGKIIFTSGATEANNLALLGAAPEGWPVIVSAIEHASVLNCLPVLAARGCATAQAPVDRSGCVDLDRLEALLRAAPAFVSIMSANNEIGSIQPLPDIARMCRRHGAILHVDAVQSLSTAAIDVRRLGIDLLSLSGHKLYGPMGVGALFVRDGLALRPQVHGGGQQSGRRSGTVPVALAVGLGVACRLARERRDDDAQRIARIRDRLYARLCAAIPGLTRNSPSESCLPGCLNIGVTGVDAADLLLDIPHIALSTGSACGAGGPSHVLSAIGLTDEQAHASLRFGVGRQTAEDEIDRAAAALAAAVRGWRSDPASPSRN